MGLSIGSNTVSKVYLGSSEVSKIYLGSTQVFPSENQQAQQWLLTRQTNGETVTEHNITSENIPFSIQQNGTTYFQITQLSEDGSSAEVTDVLKNRSTNISPTATYTSTDQNNYAKWTFSMPDKFKITVNCVPV